MDKWKQKLKELYILVNRYWLLPADWLQHLDDIYLEGGVDALVSSGSGRAYLCSWEGWKAETLTLFSRTSPYSNIQTLNTQLLSFWNFSTFFQGIWYDVNVVSIDIYFLVFNNFRFVWEYYKNGILIMTYYVNCKAIKVKYIE